MAQSLRRKRINFMGNTTAKPKNIIDMTEGAIARKLLSFAVPMIGGLLFQQMYTAADTIIVGKFVSKAALAAVGSTTPLVNTFISLSAGIGAGASVVNAQNFGAHDDEGLSRSANTTIVLSVLIGILITGLGLLFAGPMLHLMNVSEDVFNEARAYLNIYFAGALGLSVYNMGSGILRAVGDSRRPLYFLIFSASLNVVLDLLFVVVFHQGIVGAAYATILTQFLSAILVLWVLFRSKEAYGVRWNKLRLTGSMVKRIVQNGIPTGLQQGLTAFSNVFVISYIAAFGDDCLAGYSAYVKLDGFLMVPCQAMAIAVTTYVGQNYGAGKYERAHKGVKCGLAIISALTVIMSIAISLLSDYAILLFANKEDTQVVYYGSLFIRYISLFFVTQSILQTLSGALRGINKARIPMIVMLASFVVFRQIYLAVATPLGIGVLLTAFSYPFGWVLATILMTVCYFRQFALIRAKENSHE